MTVLRTRFQLGFRTESPPHTQGTIQVWAHTFDDAVDAGWKLLSDLQPDINILSARVVEENGRPVIEPYPQSC